jgi:hypothetical protein
VELGLQMAEHGETRWIETAVGGDALEIETRDWPTRHLPRLQHSDSRSKLYGPRQASSASLRCVPYYFI